MILETGKNIVNSIVVGVNACISLFFSWSPNAEVIAGYDKLVSLIAGIIAIIVGIMTIINYIKKWKTE